MKIKKKFLQLTRITYPHGTEKFLESFLPQGYKVDKWGNYYLSIGDDYSTMFTCHLDTACKSMSSIKHVFHNHFIMTDGTTILGADDKAGMVVVLYMIEKKIPGLYYFFIGEECGCIGSSNLAQAFADGDADVPQELNRIQKVVSFDRKGTQSIITYQFYGQCCSDEFAEALAQELNKSRKLSMKPDDTGVMTDSAQFINLIPECTNISVGYYNEHTFTECQDINYLHRLCQSLENVDWNSLPVVRDPSSYNTWDWEYDDSPYDESRTLKQLPDPTPIISKDQHLTKNYHDYSDDYYTYILEDGVRKKAYISQTWIAHEKLSILGLLKRQGRKVDEISWDGTSCFVVESGNNHREYIGNRHNFIQYLEEFGQIPYEHLKFDLVFVS